MTICAWYVQYFVALGAGLGHWGPKIVQLEMKIISTWRLRGTWGPKMVQVEMKIISTWRLPGPLGPRMVQVETACCPVACAVLYFETGLRPVSFKNSYH